ncbi:MAG: phosphatase PAP2 family protein [Stellaceae bacterium]
MQWRDAIGVITDLGDSALLIPASALVVLCLLWRKAARGAAIFTSALALCAGLTLALKIGFHACGVDAPLLDIHSPSGHTSLSTTFYACSALLISGDKDRWTRWSVFAVSAALAAAIAASRVIVEAHTGNEVILGLLVGACCVAWFGWRYFDGPTASLPWQAPLLGFLAAVVLTHGWRLNIEAVVAAVASALQSRFPVCS